MTCVTPMPETVTIHVPFQLVKRGGRKEILLPSDAPTGRQPDGALVKALGRAFRWKRMLESREFGTLVELAEREGIAPSYMTRILRLAFLAPDIVEAILGGRLAIPITAETFRYGFNDDWDTQRRMLGWIR